MPVTDSMVALKYSLDKPLPFFKRLLWLSTDGNWSFWLFTVFIDSSLRGVVLLLDGSGVICKKTIMTWRKFWINPLTPVSDQERISPHSFNAPSSRQVMRIKKNSNHGSFSRSNTKFSRLTLQELYGR